MIKTAFMPHLLLSKLSFGHESNRVFLISASRLKTLVNSLVKDDLKLFLNVQDRIPECSIAVPLPALLVRLPDELHRWLITFFGFLLCIVRLYRHI